MSWYPKAERVAWTYPHPDGMPTYYRGQNAPIAVVQHTMQGWFSTARQWAIAGFYPKSWHFTVGMDGAIMQHLDFPDGGYHAGVTDTQARTNPPVWPLWKGLGKNINTYVLGIEHAGFSVIPNAVTSNPAHKVFADPRQRAASKELNRWIASELGIPLDRAHFPPHADIDVVNRKHDPLPPGELETWYLELFEEGDMTPEERARLERLERLAGGYGVRVGDGSMLAGEDALKHLDEVVNYSAPLTLDNLNASLTEHKANHTPGSVNVPEHRHEMPMQTLGVSED